ncbi:DUF362 domain-containing protein [Methanoplanus sp. FWC-SCC4]|uniref:DUF362 domain-containing protein n=1 Tax=Methanochimaera problematica TaxID=2609417 RepID=A0AA97FCR1_9EURY|nr:DUF362 domain-containing protein [Methanoplanus sp. FWC-SCC4]WOF17015.1 DUF362 domain-containing protein [Methanoplanus sp. FWC-SCC4]
MTSKVYFANLQEKKPFENTIELIDRLFDESDAGNIIEKGDLAGIKVHFGERGCDTYTNPVFVRRIVDKIKAKGGKPFLTDTDTLYSGSRFNSVDHMNVAIEHGFDYAVTGAPIIISGGLKTDTEALVEINKKHFKTVRIAPEIIDSDCMFVISHFKGHVVAGFGGAIKNLGMGCATREGKRDQHNVLQPHVDENSCNGCKKCARICPVSAPEISEGVCVINEKVCVSCGQCVPNCPENAISFNWDTDIVPFTERLSEYALGAVLGKEKKIYYINFVINVTPHCDCASWSDPVIVPDIGILASDDPVAIDAASRDLVNAQRGIMHTHLHSNFEEGEDKFKGTWEYTNGDRQLEYGQEIGLGSMDYELIRI